MGFCRDTFTGIALTCAHTLLQHCIHSTHHGSNMFQHFTCSHETFKPAHGIFVHKCMIKSAIDTSTTRLNSKLHHTWKLSTESKNTKSETTSWIGTQMRHLKASLHKWDNTWNELTAKQVNPSVHRSNKSQSLKIGFGALSINWSLDWHPPF